MLKQSISVKDQFGVKHFIQATVNNRPLAKIIFQPTPCCKLQQLNSDVNPCVYAYFDNV